MNRFVKSMLALGITSAISISAAHAASYQITDKGDVASHKYSYAQQENELQQMVLSGTSVYNFPVQYGYLDDDDYNAIARYALVNFNNVHELNNLEDLDALKAGTPTPNDYAWVVKWLESQGSNSLYQKVGGTAAMVNLAGNTEEFTVFDVVLPGTETLSRSTIDVVKGITTAGLLYGNASAPYLPQDFTESDGDQVTHWYREFSNRAFYSFDSGITVNSIIPPSESESTTSYGGISGVLDISANKVAVGFMSTEMNSQVIDRIQSSTDSTGCANPSYIDDIPADICIQSYRDSNSLKAYEIRAFKASLNETGDVVTENLGLLITPHADDTKSYESYAQAVNDNGVVVGYSHGWVDEKQTNPSSNQQRNFYAVVYKDGKATSLTEDHGLYWNSRAYDINNLGIAIGHITLGINGKERTKFYYVDTTNVDEMKMVLPEDYFDSSSSTARAINDKGFVVGEGEVETHNDNTSNPRRTHGFLYDMNNDVFTDLNDLTACATPYSIIEARDINEDNVISATAVVKVDRKDALGNLMYDSDGNALKEDVVRAVTLTPMPDDGEVCTAEEENKVVRQGASFGFLSIFVLFSFGIIRRKINKKY